MHVGIIFQIAVTCGFPWRLPQRARKITTLLAMTLVIPTKKSFDMVFDVTVLVK